MGDEVERKYASKEKKRLRDMATYSFKRFQEQAYLSSRNPEVAKAAAEKKEADLKANRDKAAAKVSSNTVNYDLVSNKLVSQMLFCGLNFLTRLIQKLSTISSFALNFIPNFISGEGKCVASALCECDCFSVRRKRRKRYGDRRTRNI